MGWDRYHLGLSRILAPVGLQEVMLFSRALTPETIIGQSAVLIKLNIVGVFNNFLQPIGCRNS